MPTLDLDFGGINEIPPEGLWRFICNSGTYKANKAKDGYLIELDVMMVDPPDDKFMGFKPFPRPMGSLKTSARWKLQEIMEAVTGEDWKDDSMSIEIDDSDNTVPVLAGKTFLAVCTHRTYNGRTNLSLDTFIKDDGTMNIGETLEAPTGL